MLNKRIAGIVAGASLTLSTVVAPQAIAAPVKEADGKCYEVISSTVREVVGYKNATVAYQRQQGWEIGRISGPDGFSFSGTQLIVDDNVAPGDYTVTLYHKKPYSQAHEVVTAVVEAEEIWEEHEVTEKIEVDCPVIPENPEDGSSDAAGSALLGLSALAGSALLSSGGSSAIPDGDGSGPGSADLSSGSSDQDNGNGGDNGAGTGNGGDDAEGPAQGPVDSPDSKATGQQPATGPVGGQDPKAVAQAQAANAPAAAPAKAAPAAQQAAPAPAAQQQLANTGVQGTLIALAAGLAAIAAGALLVLRRRA